MNTFSKKNRLVFIAALLAILVGFGTVRIIAHRVIRNSLNSGQGNYLNGNGRSGDRNSRSWPGRNFRLPDQKKGGVAAPDFFLQKRMFEQRFMFRQFHGQLLRNPGIVVFLSLGMIGIITIGILKLVLIGKVAKKINKFYEGDGRQTTGAIKYLLLSILTLGIYSLLWLYMLGDRMQEGAGRYNLSFKESGGVILLWSTLGALILVGPFVSAFIVFKNTDKLEIAYNNKTEQ